MKNKLSKLIIIYGKSFGGLSLLEDGWRAWSKEKTGKKIDCGIGLTDEFLAVDGCKTPEEAMLKLMLKSLTK